MGKYQKNSHASFQMFTLINNKVGNLSKILIDYLTANKRYDKKTGRHSKLKHLYGGTIRVQGTTWRPEVWDQ